jgi:molybdenum cofactor biosynthesis enzyme MoaA
LESGIAMLARYASELHLDLRVIAAEPDRKEQTRLLTAHAARASLIRDTCAQVRAAVRQEGATSNEPALHRTVEDIKAAVTAVHLRGRAYQDLSRL